ncbi:VanZ-like family protein [Desulforapulum autotrophicum HRM2]|uniref:VanZ-like family protein n=1 Tax=Desulforapulum autotrophicum (strain ATCC 43914 / DSM 3382 / VKM B-1955 / HRM2) TaxID=177437 RepID=C0QCN8_DESAH|nr:VanZ family protein [Desulforapulum autotrophicum]ACN15115.1 VanZ-like family protein [Desulforapulum autotrophicum HRM2]
MNFYRAARLPLLLMVLIFAESSIPMDGGPHDIKFLTDLNPNLQNLLHIPLYACLAFLWFRSFSRLRVNTAKGVVLALFITILYGSLDEVHQTFVPGRYGGLIDIYLNTVGAVIGIFLFKLWAHVPFGLSKLDTVKKYKNK